MLKCRELVVEADALLDGDLGWRRRLALRLHLFLCVDCRRYLRQLKLMLAALAHSRPATNETQIRELMARIRSGDRDQV
jgi:hypothetical protein